jgi:hypothetical protein
VSVVPLLVAAALLARQSPMPAQSPDTQLPVSIDRIRAGLKQQPSSLQLATVRSDAVPTFHVEVRAPFFVAQPPEEKPFDPTFGLPSVGELLLDGVDRIRAATRAHAEHRARKQVDAALAAFCAERGCPAAKPPR